MCDSNKYLHYSPSGGRAPACPHHAAERTAAAEADHGSGLRPTDRRDQPAAAQPAVYVHFFCVFFYCFMSV